MIRLRSFFYKNKNHLLFQMEIKYYRESIITPLHRNEVIQLQARYSNPLRQKHKRHESNRLVRRV